MNTKYFFLLLTVLLTGLASSLGQAQTIYTENFTGANSTNQWYFFNGACLTAGSSTSTSSPGFVPGCQTVWSNYYSSRQDSDPYLVGGNSGYLGATAAPSSGSTQTPDPVGSGALRFTNGYPYGHQERGAIVSANTFDTGSGIQVTFKTVTYHGDSGGTGRDGADGISFFLMNGAITPTAIGATGGSLGYSCTNESGNVPYDGLTGGYIGLGIDEFGNFLNGTNLVTGYTGSNSATGDNSAYGYGFKPDRIGMRGAGNISWAALNAAYGTYQGSSLPYYPSSLATTYGNSTYSCGTSSNNSDEFCWSCPTAYTSYSGAPSTPTGVVTGTSTTCTYTLYSSVGTCPAATTYTSYSGAPSTPTGTVTFSGGHCVDTVYSSVATCPAATSYTSYSGAPSTPAGTITFSGSNCIDTLYSSVSACPANTSYASYTGAPSSPLGTITFSSSHCVDTVSYNALAKCPAASSYAFYGAPNASGTITFSGGKCVDTIGTTKYNGPTTVAYTGPSSAAYTGPATAAYTGPSTATYTTAPTTGPVTVTGGSGTTLAQAAVRQACSTGTLYNYYDPAAPTAITTATLTTSSGSTNTANPAGILDYAPIPGAYKELTAFTIGAESAATRSAATPILYNLKITQNGLLSLSYSTGGAYSYIIQNQSITSSNGPLPATFRFGFAGSTGGDTNIHEIMCFKAASATTSGSSASVNQKQAAKVEAGSQAYFAFYNPNDWTGSITANTLIDTAGVVTISSTANWDAQCLLSGTPSGAPAAGGGCASTNISGPTSATPAPASRVMLTWDTVNNVGIPFEWASLNSSQQGVLDDENNTPDVSANSHFRLNYLRGDRSNEITTAGTGLYRARDGILSDIVDSSPSWVGPPSSPYTAAWSDHLQVTSMPENSGTQNYLQFVSAEQGRLNVVYAGANDGFLHGFEAGSFDSNGNFCGTCATTPNDGKEVIAYMPGSVLYSPALSTTTGGCAGGNLSTGTAVQNIHGWTPAIGTGSTATTQCETPELDFSATPYGHNFFVDATPGTGDLFYNGTWHTWLVSGLGIGGQAIFALDITNPSAFSEGGNSPQNLVIGEWNSASITCTNVSTCGNDLGNTFGTPLIRRLHNGSWAAIFGNGFGSVTGDAGIYIMSISTSGAVTFYYLGTGTGTGTSTAPCSANCNGIAYTTAADLDGDHITDYVYAGDLKGNVWRFDLTSATPSQWGVTNSGGASVNKPTGSLPGQAGGGTAAPLFTTQGGQPITSQVLVVSSIVPGTGQLLLIEFGTGERTQITNSNPEQFVGGTQSLYGVWDWNLSSWNALAPGSSYASLAGAATGLSSPYTATYQNLTAQTLTLAGSGTVNGTNVTVCWAGTTSCPATINNSFGWYANLPSTSEQIIFNPVYFQGAIFVNSTIPAVNTLTSCTINSDTGYTYVLSVTNGGVFNDTFPNYSYTNPATNIATVVSDPTAAGILTNATGSVYVVSTVEKMTNIIFQTVSSGGSPGTGSGSGSGTGSGTGSGSGSGGTGGSDVVHLPPNTIAKRLTWVELR